MGTGEDKVRGQERMGAWKNCTEFKSIMLRENEKAKERNITQSTVCM